MYKFHDRTYNKFVKTNNKHDVLFGKYVKKYNNNDVKYILKIHNGGGIKDHTIAEKKYGNIDLHNKEHIYCSLVKDFNEELPDFLEGSNINFFVPKRSPHYKLTNNTIRLYYHHDADVYNMMNHKDYPEVVYAPDGSYKKKLNNMYAYSYDIVSPYK